MEKIHKEKDRWGQYVIYVEKCKKYMYENPDGIKKQIFSLHNGKQAEICDIIDTVESYYCK